MSGRRKLSSAAVEFIITSVTQRRELARQLRMLPTNAVLADELGVSERWVAAVIRKNAQVTVSCETANSADTSLRLNNPQ